MKKLSCFTVIVVLAVCAGACSGGLRAVNGSDWLASKATEPPGMNISGDWNSRSWGLVTIKQEGSKISGEGDGWPMKGVISGKRAYLVFFDKRVKKVYYTAQLQPGKENALVGHYSKYAFIGEKGARKIVMTLTGGTIKE